MNGKIKNKNMNLKKFFIFVLFVSCLPMISTAQALTQTAKNNQLQALQNQLNVLQKTYDSTKAQFDAHLARIQQQIDAVKVKIDTLDNQPISENTKPQINFVSGSLVKKLASDNAQEYGEATFIIKVKAGSDEMIIDSLFSSNIFQNQSGFFANLTNSNVGKLGDMIIATDADIQNGKYIIYSGQEKTFQLSAIVDKVSRGTVAVRPVYFKYYLNTAEQKNLRTYSFPYNLKTNNISFGVSCVKPQLYCGYSKAQQVIGKDVNGCDLWECVSISNQPELSLISATIKKISGGNLSDTAEGTITFKIKALESDVFIPIGNGVEVYSFNKPNSLVSNLSSTANINGDKYVVYSGETKTFQLNGFITPQRTGYYDLRFGSLKWGTTSDSILSTISTSTDRAFVNWRTPNIYLISRNQQANYSGSNMQANLSSAQALLDQLRNILISR